MTNNISDERLEELIESQRKWKEDNLSRCAQLSWEEESEVLKELQQLRWEKEARQPIFDQACKIGELYHKECEQNDKLRKQKALLIEDGERLARRIPLITVSGEEAYRSIRDKEVLDQHKELMEKVKGDE